MYKFLLGTYLIEELLGHRFTSTQLLEITASFQKCLYKFHTHQKCMTHLVYTQLYPCLVFSVIFILVLWLVCDVNPGSERQA